MRSDAPLRGIVMSTLFALLAFGPSASVAAQSPGVLKGKAYFDLVRGLADSNEEVLTFQFRRIYFTYDMRMSETVSGRFRTDAEQEDDGVTRIFMKHAYVDWKPGDQVTVRAGQQSTIMFGEIEEVFGYRSIAKTMQNEFKFRATTDFGLAAGFDLGEHARLNLMMSNGEGFKSPDDDAYRKAWEVQAVLFPVSPLMVSLHAGRNGYDEDGDPDTTGDQGDAFTLDLSVGYRKERWAVGFSATRQEDFRATPGARADAFSAFGKIRTDPAGKITLLARLDVLRPTGSTLYDDVTYGILGMDYAAAPGLSIIPNLQYRKTGGADPVLSGLLTFYWRW